MIVDVTSKNGNLLLNVGPTANGLVPWAQASRLLAVGDWLRRNGEAIYGTRPWRKADGRTADGAAVRFTQRRGYVYAIVLAKPAGNDCRARRSATRRRDGGSPARLRRAAALATARCAGRSAPPGDLPTGPAYALRFSRQPM